MFFKKKTSAEQENAENARFKILGSGCAKCRQLEQNTEQALKQLQISNSIGHVTDFEKIAQYGVMTTPALVVDEKVLSAGRVLSAAEIVDLLQKK